MRDIASGVSGELWHGRRLRHAKHRIAYLPSTEELISSYPRPINQSLELGLLCFLQQEFSSRSPRIYRIFDFERNRISRNSRDERTRRLCVLSEREGWLECQQALETEFHLASLNIGWKRRGTHPSAAGSFVSRCGQQHRWHWRRKLPPGSGGAYATKRPIHRTSNKRTLPRDRYKGSIVYRIVRSINHRPKKSGDFLTYALSAPLRRRDAERITFLDRNDHYARSRKKDQILSTTN